MDEAWEVIDDCDGIYKVSSLGRMINTKTGKIYEAPKRKMYGSEYYSVALKDSKHGKTKTLYLHRAVAKAFVPNPEGKPIVNHIDGNKLNNRADNLEWVTYKENTVHAVNSGLLKVKKPVSQYEYSGTLIARYDSAKSAADSIGGRHDHILYACHSRSGRAYGYIWRFSETDR